MEKNQLTIHWHRGNRTDLGDVGHGIRAPKADSRPFASTLHADLVAERPLNAGGDGVIDGSRSRLGDAAKAVAASGCLLLATGCFLLLCVGRRIERAKASFAIHPAN